MEGRVEVVKSREFEVVLTLVGTPRFPFFFLFTFFPLLFYSKGNFDLELARASMKT